MTRDDPLSRLADQLRTLMPGNPPAPAELAQELQLVVQGLLARAELVTREEFDTQAAVLRATRARLEELEALARSLEARLAEAEGTAASPDAAGDG